MKTPIFLLGAALIFWGWQTGLWLFAIPMAVIIEASHWISWRWDFTAADIRRIAMFSLFILIFLIIYISIHNPIFYLIYTLLQWLAVALFPLIVAQVYSVEEKIDVTALFLFLMDGKTIRNQSFTIDISYPYLAACILSASNANVDNISFYTGMVVILAIALWSIRSKRFSPIAWICLMILAGSLGFIGQIGLHKLHLAFEESVVSWYSDITQYNINLSHIRTNIGDLGELKQSNKIIFRVATENQQASPSLLREASYNKYYSSTWGAVEPNFNSVQPAQNGTSWRLDNTPSQLVSLEKQSQKLQPPILPEKDSKITISTTLHNSQSLLTLPNGTFEINELPVSQMEKNKYGTVKVTGKVNRIQYQAYFNQDLSWDNPPTSDDLQIPNKEKAALNQILEQLDIQGKSPQQIVNRVDSFFLKNFTYSLQLSDRGNSSTPLAAFLLENRAGHCEYFATATTLLLRAAGIPARYAVGYSVHEFSNLENQYIVRSRHAHAWTMVYLHGKWQVLDTTPSNWRSAENAAVSKLSIISDLGSLLSFRLSGGLEYLLNSQKIKYGWYLIFPLIFILMWKLGSKKGVRRLSPKQRLLKPNVKAELSQSNSDFYLIENALKELGLSRHPSEPLKAWIQRIKEDATTADLIDGIIPIVELHYRDRFDPAGIKEAEKTRLNAAIRSWLDLTYSRAIASSRNNSSTPKI